MKRRTTTRLITTSALALGILFSTTAPASADHHLVKIREFSMGASAGNDAFIEIQMYEPGQNLLVGHLVRLINSNGSADTSPVITGVNPPNSQSQRTVLIGDTAGALGDVEITGLETHFEAAATAGGAICFLTTIDPMNTSDCVSWGNFSGPGFAGPLPTSAGTPITGSLAAGMAFRRTITGSSCATALDAADDTNDSMADFATVTQDPTPNATVPPETLCVPPATSTPPGNPTSPINPAGHVRKRKCKKSNRAAAAKKKKCKKKK